MNNIDIYIFPYNQDNLPEFFNDKRLIELLPEERQKRIARYKFQKDKLLSMFAGLMIHYSYYLRYGDIVLPEIICGEFGKPFFRNETGKEFSVSHTFRKGKGLVAAAFSSEPAGVDAEFIKESNLQIADHFFTEAESAYIHSSENPYESFCKVWTRKEAFVKCSGEGLQHGFDSFSVIDKKSENLFLTEKYPDSMLSLYSAKPYNNSSPVTVTAGRLKDFCLMLLENK